MTQLMDMIWIEYRKAIRSKLPLWTSLGSLFMPLGIAFVIFVARHPEISQQLGLISAKANLLAYSATDWPTYLSFSGQLIAAGGFFFFILIISWVFGREFSDRTMKDLLAVPVRRVSIVLAKFLVAALWCFVLTALIFVVSLVVGSIIKLPGGSISVMVQDSTRVVITALLVIATILPFALLASVGRGYLLPLGCAVLVLMMANLAMILGWGEYFPWAVPGLLAQGKVSLTPISFWLVVFTGLLGMIATYYWWMYADQSR